ncbi:MAG: serine acetyltransferase [Eubacteriales bacterium]|nr:serine acetyltransferase [Eubacteriales bacterium]
MERDIIAQRRKDLLKALEGVALPCENPITDSALVPDRRKVILLIKDLQSLLFPGYFRVSGSHRGEKGDLYTWALQGLAGLIRQCLPFFGNGKSEGRDAGALALSLMERLPEIKRLLVGDIQAIYEGDPAARSCEEVLICYPGFYAISIHRLAHALYLLDIPLLPRVMGEYAHEKTGIDIHPGAAIGQRFCIDHGTGIVIGETAVLGDDVKLYQGVTLGARSFALDPEENPVKGVKRHPRIGHRVVIYANAVILGGDTVVGDGCVIGGNVWLTESLPDNQIVYYDGDRIRNRAL